MGTAAEVIGWIVIGIAFVAGMAVLLSLPVWLLWNWLCPTIFGLPKISLLQALGLNFLAGVLFGSWSRGGK